MISFCKPLRQPLFQSQATMKSRPVAVSGIVALQAGHCTSRPAGTSVDSARRLSVLFASWFSRARHSFNCQQAVQELASLPKRLSLTGFRAAQGAVAARFPRLFWEPFWQNSLLIQLGCYVMLYHMGISERPFWPQIYHSTPSCHQSMFPRSFPLLFSIGLYKPWPTWPLT